jgi:hypothetical protein
MKELKNCPVCGAEIVIWYSEIPYCNGHGRFGFLRRIWWGTGIPGFFKSR